MILGLILLTLWETVTPRGAPYSTELLMAELQQELGPPGSQFTPKGSAQAGTAGAVGGPGCLPGGGLEGQRELFSLSRPPGHPFKDLARTFGSSASEGDLSPTRGRHWGSDKVLHWDASGVSSQWVAQPRHADQPLTEARLVALQGLYSSEGLGLRPFSEDSSACLHTPCPSAPRPGTVVGTGSRQADRVSLSSGQWVLSGCRGPGLQEGLPGRSSELLPTRRPRPACPRPPTLVVSLAQLFTVLLGPSAPPLPSPLSQPSFLWRRSSVARA